MDKNNFNTNYWDNKETKENENYNNKIFETGRKINSVERILSNFNIIIKLILIFLAITIFIGIIALLVYRWGLVYRALHIEPKEALEDKYNIRLNEISDNTDSRGNGTYVFEVDDDTLIQFNALEDWSRLSDDYEDNCQKYYYDNWENSNKDIVKTKTSYENNILLNFEQYIEIENEDEIENAVRLLYDFVISAQNKFSTEWNLYLEIDNNKISLFDSDEIDINQEIKKAEEEYRNFLNSNVSNEERNEINNNIINEINNLNVLM